MMKNALLCSAGLAIWAASAVASAQAPPPVSGSVPISLTISPWVQLVSINGNTNTGAPVPMTMTVNNGAGNGSLLIPFVFSTNDTGSISVSVAKNNALVQNTRASSPWTWTTSGLAPTTFSPGGSQSASFSVNVSGILLTDQAGSYATAATATITLTGN